MNKYIILLALALTFVSAAPEKNWGVLVAGSKNYQNYRHQSDVFHAYHILKDHGIPEENIILFAYDDIANSRSNPIPEKYSTSQTEKMFMLELKTTTQELM